jgi:hypothetical protein
VADEQRAPGVGHLPGGLWRRGGVRRGQPDPPAGRSCRSC